MLEIKNKLLSKLNISKQKNKLLYHFQFNEEDDIHIPSRVKWLDEFENDDIEWKDIFTLYRNATLDVKLRNFQYKYLFRITPRNKRLFKQKIVNSNLCEFCNMYIECLKHLFWECNHTQIFWNNLLQFLKGCNININLNFKTIYFGLN